MEIPKGRRLFFCTTDAAAAIDAAPATVVVCFLPGRISIFFTKAFNTYTHK